MGLWWKKLINFQSTCQKCHAKMSGGKGDEKAAALPWELCLFPGPELTPYRESWAPLSPSEGLMPAQADVLLMSVKL